MRDDNGRRVMEFVGPDVLVADLCVFNHPVVAVPHTYASNRLYTSDGKIDSNRFTLPNRNEKFRFSTTATTL